METRTKLILATAVLAVLTITFDWHLYLFDRPKYLIRKSVQKCVSAEMANTDYYECKTVGFRDKRCEYFRATYIEKAGECEAAQAALDAEVYRHRAR